MTNRLTSRGALGVKQGQPVPLPLWWVDVRHDGPCSHLIWWTGFESEGDDQAALRHGQV